MNKSMELEMVFKKKIVFSFIYIPKIKPRGNI